VSVGLSVGEADAWLAKACVRHGGDAAFASARCVSLRLADLGGVVPWVKGVGRKFRSPAAVDVWPHDRRAVFYEFPAEGQVGVYAAGRVAIGLDPDARLDGPSHRLTFQGVGRWRTWWPHDAIYFLGYALVHYLSLPFALRGLPLVDARRRGDGVELWYRFGTGSDRHSAVEGFRFDASGLLVRHDYRAEIMGAAFNGAHVSRGYREIDGRLLATERTVYLKPWHYPVRMRLPVPVLRARIEPRDAR
jgi:hypothetical protein